MVSKICGKLCICFTSPWIVTENKIGLFEMCGKKKIQLGSKMYILHSIKDFSSLYGLFINKRITCNIMMHGWY